MNGVGVAVALSRGSGFLARAAATDTRNQYEIRKLDCLF